MSFEIMIDPKIEMLGIIEYFADPGIQTLLSDKVLSPKEVEYKDRIVNHFSSFQSHQAISRLVSMKEQNFQSSQAVRLLLYHSQIPYLFSQPVIQNQKNLDWIQILRDWIDKTKFPTFIEQNKSFYQEIKDYVETELELIPICDVIELFFGEKRNSYHVFLSSIKTGDFNVFLPNKGDGAIIGAPILNSPNIYPRILHEFSYLYIRPSIDLFWSHFHEINEKPQYSRAQIYEIIVQAILTVLVPDRIPENSLQITLVDRISREYQTKRDIYPTFSTYIPRLAKFITRDQ